MPISTLYRIFTRNYERKNNISLQRQEIAKELKTNCHQWSKMLFDYFEKTIEISQTEGKDVALRHMDKLMMDVYELDYDSLKEESKLFPFLNEDKNYQDFSNSCISFYKSALDIKRLVYGTILNHKNQLISVQDTEIKIVIATYRNEVTQILSIVNDEYHGVSLPKNCTT